MNPRPGPLEPVVVAPGAATASSVGAVETSAATDWPASGAPDAATDSTGPEAAADTDGAALAAGAAASTFAGIGWIETYLPSQIIRFGLYFQGVK